jgi:hypothetical protein
LVNELTPSRKTKQDYEAEVAMLAGHRLAGVRYFELQYEGGYSGWRSVPEVGDSLHLGVDLVMADGSVFGLTWGAQFHHHDVMLVPHSLREELAQFTEVSVSDEPQWRPYIGKVLSRVEVFWSWVEIIGEGRIHFPQDVALCFDSLPTIYVTASEYMPEKDELFPMADELTVVFSDEVARKHRIGPYAAD